MSKDTGKSAADLLEHQLRQVGTNLGEITNISQRIEEPTKAPDGEVNAEGFRIVKKKVGAAAVKAKRLAHRAYRATKGKAKRLAKRFRRTSAFKMWTKLRKRLGKRIKSLAGTGKRLILRKQTAGYEYSSGNLAESIRAHMAEADLRATGISESLIEALETSARAADIALDLARRYDHLEDDDTCDALLDMAENLIDVGDAIEECEGDDLPESLDVKLTAMVTGLHETLEDYMGEHFVSFDEDEEGMAGF